jgi:hypothetical protein
MSEHGPTIDSTDLYQPNDYIALAMGRLAAPRVTAEGVEEVRKFVEFLRERRGDNAYLRMWDEIVKSGPEAVRQAFTEPSERGQVLRSVISFRAFVSKAERDAIFREYTRAFTGTINP